MIDEKKLIKFINSKEFQMRFIRSPKSVQEILLEFIEEQPKISERIPCNEQLPEECESVSIRKILEENTQTQKEISCARSELYKSQLKLYTLRKDMLENGTLEQKVDILTSEYIERMSNETHAQLVQEGICIHGVNSSFCGCYHE